MDALTLDTLWKKDVDGYIPILVEIYNPVISWSEEAQSIYGQSNSYIRLICDENKVIYKGKTYLPCSFEYVQPEKSSSKIGNAQLSITALDTRVRQVLRQIKGSSKVNVIAMFCKVEKETSGFVYKFVELSTCSFVMKNAGSNKSVATFNLVFDDFTSQNTPYDIATQDRVPGTKK